MDKFDFKYLEQLFKVQQKCNPTASLIYNWMLIRLSTELYTDTHQTRRNVEGATFCKDIGTVDNFNGIKWLKVSIQELSKVTNKSERMIKYAVDKLCISGFLHKKKHLKKEYEQNYYYSLVEFSQNDALKPAEMSKVQFLALSKVQKVAPSLYTTVSLSKFNNNSGGISSYSSISAHEHYELFDRQAKVTMPQTTTTTKKNLESEEKKEGALKVVSTSKDDYGQQAIKDWSGPEDEMARVWNEILGFKKRICVAYPGAEQLLKSVRASHFPSLDEWRAYCTLIRSSPKLTGIGWDLSLHWACNPHRIREVQSGEWRVQLPGVAERQRQEKALTEEYPASKGYSNLPEGHPDGAMARAHAEALARTKAKYTARLAEQGLPFIEPEELAEMQNAVEGGFDPAKPWAEQFGLVPPPDETMH